MPRDGCKECSKRRITCDKQVPECGKCQKKGIKCSGTGRQIRFADGIAVRGKFKGKTRPVLDDGDDVVSIIRQSTNESENQSLELAVRRPGNHEGARDEDGVGEALEFPSASSMSRVEGEGDLGGGSANWTGFIYPRYHDHQVMESRDTHGSIPLIIDPRASMMLETLKPGIRMLFTHCKYDFTNNSSSFDSISDMEVQKVSKSIAWIMVVFDHGTNGYRDIVLPLAYQDELVQRAVSVTAAFHLAAEQPDLLSLAESGRAAIIAKLRKDAMSGDVSKVFSLSTWVTIILLLVGETITGSREFIQLYNMMASLSKQQTLLNIPASQLTFILQQTRMFQLFTPPLLDSSQGLATLQGDISLYLNTMFTDYLLHAPSHLSQHIPTFQSAISQTRNLYILQALHSRSPDTLYLELETLRLTVLPITAQTPGMHVMVWVYFVAAASSCETLHRRFLGERLREVWENTRMGNILVALKRLERIWEVQAYRNWAREPRLVDPVLII